MERVVSYTFIETPVGRTMIAWCDEGLVAIRFGDVLPRRAVPDGWCRVDGVATNATRALDGYFAGDVRQFDLPVVVSGTPFQRAVWAAVSKVPYGETRSYAQIAAALGRPRAVRAVGAANGRNDLPIVIPCHRVIASDGSLHGYAGGIAIKAALLAFEREGVWPASLAPGLGL